MRVAVAGGTGRIGALVVQRLTEAAHTPVSLSRSEGVDLLTGEGLAERLTGVDALIDVSNPMVGDADEAERVFTAVAQNLLDTGTAAGVRHLVLLSIAGLDRVVGNPHYAGKRAQERAVRSGSLPWTVLRATQFHDFPAMIAEWAVADGEAHVPPLLLQPIAPGDVADALVSAALGTPAGGTIEIAGPRTEDAVDMARRTFAARGVPQPILATWRGAALGIEFAGEALIPGDGVRIAPTSFDDWLSAGA